MNSSFEILFDALSSDAKTIENNARYWEASENHSNLIEIFKSKLSEEDQELLNKIFMQSGLMEFEATRTYFEKGYKMGLISAMEAFLEK